MARHPLHVVLRVRKEVGRLRRGEVYASAHRALIRIAARTAFRVVHLSLQHNHVHLLVEAANKDALSSGMRALAISLARRINRSLERTGPVFAFRYHATALRSPTQTRNALAYVLNNWRRHREDERRLESRSMRLDPYSSGVLFTGWADFRLGRIPDGYDPLPVAEARTWLLRVGWERAGRAIRTSETPGPLH